MVATYCDESTTCMRTNDCDSHTRAGRLAKAQQFADAAREVLLLADEAMDVADAFVTLAVHSGIAAADAVCCRRLGVYARPESHHDSVELLSNADNDAARHLRTLLGMKTRAGYSHVPVSAQDRISRGTRDGCAPDARTERHMSAGADQRHERCTNPTAPARRHRPHHASSPIHVSEVNHDDSTLY